MQLVFVRSIILFFVAMLMIRLMGKREIGQLQPYEFVITIVIAELAGAAMSDISIPLLYGIIAITACFICHYIISVISRLSENARRVISGKPAIIIDKGIIDYKEMKKLDFNMNDLIAQLRSKDQFDLSEVYYAILETNGKLTVFPRSAVKIPDVTDLKLNVAQQDIPHTLISDGKPHTKTLNKLNADHEWLLRQVRAAGYNNIKDILFASYTNGVLFLHTKDRQFKKVFTKLPEGVVNGA